MFTLANHPRRAAVAALAAASALAAGAGPAAAACPGQPTAQRFMPWADPAWYAPAPDGGFEAGALGWTLAGGAAIADGNEPYFVDRRSDRRSLNLPGGSSATSPSICVGLEHPTLRFFLRNTGAPEARLAVSVLISGAGRTLPVGVLTAGPAWAPGPALPVTANVLSLVGSNQVAFRLTPVDSSGAWSVDDVFVDPYGKG
jgi:hypothetical protein